MKNSVAEKLRTYFENTPNAEIERDWEATRKYDEVGSTVKEFLCQTELLYKYTLPKDYWEFDFSTSIVDLENPKFTSDFFF